MADLAAQKLDLVVAAPADAVTKFQSGQQATIDVAVNTVDPVATGYAAFIAQVLNQQINEEIIKQAVTQGRNFAIAGNVDQAAQIPPEVIAAPTTVEHHERRAEHAERRRFRRARGTRTDAPAHGRDPDGAVIRA